MGNIEEATCALWWWRHMHLQVSLFTTEEAAALYAIEIVRSESGHPDGVQFKDGRVVDCEDWPLHIRLTAGEEVSARRDEKAARTVKSPFDNKAISFPGTYPDWVGAQ